VAVLSLAGLSALPAPTRAALSPEDTAALQTALAGKSLAEGALVPRGFVKVSEAKGDLNGDGVDDLALVVRHAPKKKPSDDDDGVPQAVLVFTGDKAAKFTLWKLGARHFMDDADDLMEKGGVAVFEIKKGVLKMTSDAMMSVGSGAGGCTLRWRNGPAGFQLIGLEKVDMDRNCACGTTKDTNYLTGLTIYTSDRDRHGEQTPKEKVKRTKGEPKTILWETFDFEKMCP
jgi:hypothetical protein